MSRERNPLRFLQRLRRSFSDFLTVPLAVLSTFVALAFAAYAVDASIGPREDWGPIWSTLNRYVGDTDSADALLETLTGSLITVTSITFSILLLAVQQGASSLTSQIFDQYLRRRSNQIYFGFFVGASLYTLLTLVLTNSEHRPVVGVSIAILIVIVALCALIALIYSTLDQTKSVNIIRSIRDETLGARERQLKWLSETAEPPAGLGAGRIVTSSNCGYFRNLDVAALRRIAHDAGVSIEVSPSLGDYVPLGGRLAVVRDEAVPSDSLDRRIRHAISVAEQRDFGADAGYGVNQIVIIGWASTSTAKSNPSAARAASLALHELLWRWSQEGRLSPARANVATVYYRDSVAEQLFDGFESIIVAASESVQHQTLATVLEALIESFPAMPVVWRDRTEQMLMSSLSALGDHLPTRLLQRRHASAAVALQADGRTEGAARIRQAWSELEDTRGQLHARGTRE